MGTITGKGTLQVNGGDDANGYLVLIGATTLSGGGAVSLTTAPGGGEAFVQGNSETLTNANTIEGSGEIGNGSLTLINSGTIDANLASTETDTGILILNGSGGITNAKGATAGLLEATNSGTLQIAGITVNNDTGAITANGGVVEFDGATIQGGTLNELSGGTLGTEANDSATLDGSTHGALTISSGSTYTTTDSNSTTDILGTITDEGTIQVNGGDDANGWLVLTTATTLNGGGTVSLTTATGGGNAFVEGNSETLTNSDLIEGSGEIGNGSLTLINSGTIDANLPASSQTGQTNTGILILDGSGGITNANGATAELLEATNGGTLQIAGMTVNNDTAAITANDGVVEFDGAMIQGGTLNELGGGSLGTQSDNSATLDGSTEGALTLSAGSTYTTSDEQHGHRHSGHDHRQGHVPGGRRRRRQRVFAADRECDAERRRHGRADDRNRRRPGVHRRQLGNLDQLRPHRGDGGDRQRQPGGDQQRHDRRQQREWNCDPDPERLGRDHQRQRRDRRTHRGDERRHAADQ